MIIAYFHDKKYIAMDMITLKHEKLFHIQRIFIFIRISFHQQIVEMQIVNILQNVYEYKSINTYMPPTSITFK